MFDIKRGKRLTVTNRIAGNRPLITAGYENMGVAGFISNDEQETFSSSTITIDMFANTFYRNYKYSADDNILVLIEKKEMLEKSKMFITSVIHKCLKDKFSYGNQFRMGSFNKINIRLPTSEIGKIDFDFMDSFITALEKERMTKLQTYLSAANLTDYTLTAKEQQVLDDFEQAEFQEFKVTDIFNVNNSKSILSRDIIENSGTTPYLCASANNNAVSTYIAYDKQHLDTGNCVFIGGKTFVVTYQEHDFYSNDSHNLILHLKDAEKSKSNQLYLATCVKKGLAHKYSWGDSISNRKIQKDIISLPVQDDKPDYAIMDTLISAIQKLVIKDVVIYLTDKAQSSPMYLNESTNSLEASEL